MASNEGREPLPDDGYSDLNETTARSLLKLTLPGQSLADELVARLKSPTGAQWLQETIQRGCGIGMSSLEEKCFQGTASVEDLKALKDVSKACLSRTSLYEEELAITLAYFLAIAAAWAHHGARISNQGLRDQRQVLLRIAAVAPPPRSGLFSGAAARILEKP